MNGKNRQSARGINASSAPLKKNISRPAAFIFGGVLWLSCGVFPARADDFFERLSGGGELALGVNTPLSSAPNGAQFEYGVMPTFCAGLGVECRLSDRTAVQVKAHYHYAGLSYTDSVGDIRTDFMTIDCPLLFKYTLGERTQAHFSVLAGACFSFCLGEAKDGTTDGFAQPETASDRSVPAGKFHAIGIELGAEYAFTGQKGFHLGFSALFDAANFRDGAHLCTRRACFMPYVGYWL